MSSPSPDELCEIGQRELSAMRYLAAEATLAQAERLAWETRNWDLLSRLYMPLQEARRQRRQRCGEGVVRLDLVAEGPADRLEARHVLENCPHGQLLVAGWGTIEPSREVRAAAARHELYVETFLAAVYPTEEGPKIVIVPEESARLPDPIPMPAIRLRDLLPTGCLLLAADELPQGAQPGTWETYAKVMSLWERLHAPFLAAAEAQADPSAKIDGLRAAIRVDYACEIAHQQISIAAAELARTSAIPAK